MVCAEQGTGVLMDLPRQVVLLLPPREVGSWGLGDLFLPVCHPPSLHHSWSALTPLPRSH